MPYKLKVILRTPLTAPADLPAFVEACLKDGVELIAVVGERCELIHDEIDEIIVGDGSDDSRFTLVTTWHEDESLEEVIEFAQVFGTDADDAVEIVQL